MTEQTPPPAQQFSLPLVENTAKQLIQGIDDFMNWLVHEKLGGAIQAGVSGLASAVQDLKGSVKLPSLGGTAPEYASASPTPDKGSEKAIQSPQIAMSQGAEKSQGMHVPDGTLVSPTYTPNAAYASIGQGVRSV